MSRRDQPTSPSLARRNFARNRRSFVPGPVGQSALEVRQVLSSATLSGGLLTVTGTAGADTIAVVQVGTWITAAGKAFATSSVRSIEVDGLDGNDAISVTSSLPATLNGGAGANTYPSVPASDTVIDPTLTGGRAMSKAVMDKYQSLGGSNDLLLGKPTGDETAAFGGRVIRFQGGEIDYSAATGAHEVHGLIDVELNATAGTTDAFGHPVRGILGLATSDESAGLGGRINHFQGGDIDWSTATGAHAVIGAIGGEYAATAHEVDAFGTSVQKILGLPTGDEAGVPNVAGARMQTFQGGTIYSSAVGTHAVIGAIGGEYAATAHEVDAVGVNVQKILGLPTGEEAGVPGVAGARMQTFQGGTIYSSAVGTHVVIGAIGAEYAATAREVDAVGTSVQKILGLPIGEETGVPNAAGARMQLFQGGTIYYSAASGTHALIGAIGAQYKAMGAAAGVLGLPTADEQAASGGRIVTFQHGSLYWSQATGVLESIAIAGIPGGSPQYDNSTCGPNSASRFLRFYGFNVSYDQMRQQIKYDGDLVSRVSMGTRPSVLLDALRKYRPQTQLESRVNINYGDGGLDHILSILATGKPVIALVNPSGENRSVPLGHLPEELHWIVLTGYDRLNRTITLTNTDGLSYTESFDKFYKQWNWSADGPIGDALTGDFNVQPRTILY